MEQTNAPRPRATVFIAAAASVVGVAAFFSGWLTPLDHSLFDALTRASQHEVTTDAALVEIDAISLRELGPWPWRRDYHAEVIDALVRAGASRIVMDIDFSSPSTAIADQRLALSARKAGKSLVLPVFWQRTSVTADSLMLFEPIPELREHAQLGSVNLAPASDGPVRRVDDLTPEGFSGSTPPLSHVLNPRHSGYPAGQLINYRISPTSFPMLSFATVLRDPEVARAFRGRTVFIGATAMELGDLVAVPVRGSLPGVLVQMLSYETARAHPLRDTPAPAGLLAVIVAAVATTLLGRRLRWSLLAVFAVAATGALTGVSAALYLLLDIWWMPLPAVAGCVTAAGTLLLLRVQGESIRAFHYWKQYRQRDALLREVVTRSAEAILTLDESGRIVTANPMAAQFLAADERALAGAPLGAFVPGVASLRPEGEVVRHEIDLQRPGAEPLTVEMTIAQIQVEGQRIVTVQMRDITLQRNRERELRHQALHDAMTGLPNRLALTEQLQAVLSDHHTGVGGALLLMDVDGFKEVNDSLGHNVGDLVLKELAGRFTRLLPPGGFVARLGGDEFALLLKRDDQVGQLQWACRAFLASASEPVLVRGVPISLGVSAGLALWPQHATDSETLLHRADCALYAAKRNHTVLETYDSSSEVNSPRRLEMLTLLRSAVRQEELYLVYQPKVELGSGEVFGFEALSRWCSPQLGEVSPAQFMPLAEATEIITPLTRWTLERGLRDCAAWRARGWPATVAINLSARLLQSSQLVEDIAELLEAARVPPKALELEITESALMSDPERAFTILTGLRGLGVQLSIDDFGTGYSSLAYLQKLQVDRLKIDRSFVENVHIDPGSRAIVASTVQLAHALGLEVVAEGIEHHAQHDILRDLGCNHGQGFFYAQGMRSEHLEAWLASRAPPVPQLAVG
ncbi:MAG: EAL domain-containing protein [Pseudomonadota bacterium]|nr:EAL domain-containing protein [Pseudomonadota bacterium]